MADPAHEPPAKIDATRVEPALAGVSPSSAAAGLSAAMGASASSAVSGAGESSAPIGADTSTLSPVPSSSPSSIPSPGPTPGPTKIAPALGAVRALRRPPVPSLPVPRSSLLFRALAALAPYALTVLVLGGLSLYYRLTLFTDVSQIHFGRRPLLLLLLAVPLLAVYSFQLRRRRLPSMVFSRTADLRATAQGPGRHFAQLPQALRIGVMALLAVALARPQLLGADIVEVEGIDIVIALDVSNSMSERDLEPDRLSAAKEVLKNFVERRKGDRIGLVIFGREAFTQCPLTLDYHALAGLLDDVRLNLVDGRGTAIGNALATALNRLRRSDAKSKVIILLTDGDNNAGNIAPQQAAKFAQSLGVKVFTVLMGRDALESEAGAQLGAGRGQTRYPVNPKLLEEIAGQTGGSPYLATDTPALEMRFQSILDELDKSRLKDQKGRPRELYLSFVYPALGLLLLEVLLSLTRFRRWP